MVSEGFILWKSFKPEKAKTDGYLFLNGDPPCPKGDSKIEGATVDTTRRDPSPP